MLDLANVFLATLSSTQETSAKMIKSDVEKTWSQDFSETFLFSFFVCFYFSGLGKFVLPRPSCIAFNCDVFCFFDVIIY